MNPLHALSLLRWQLLLAIILVAAGAAAVISASQASEQARAQLARARQDNVRASTDLQRAHLQEGAVRDAIAQYKALVEDGLIGPERRLNWVEALDAARKRHRVDTVSYEILPQRPLDSNAVANADLTWMESRMRLSMHLRHGKALLDILDELQSIRSAIVQPRSCRLERAPETSPGVNADCELRWLTLRREGGT